MNQEDWEDLLYDLASNTPDNQRHKLATHMAKLEVELESTKRELESLKLRLVSVELMSGLT